MRHEKTNKKNIIKSSRVALPWWLTLSLFLSKRNNEKKTILLSMTLGTTTFNQNKINLLLSLSQLTRMLFSPSLSASLCLSQNSPLFARLSHFSSFALFPFLLFYEAKVACCVSSQHGCRVRCQTVGV